MSSRIDELEARRQVLLRKCDEQRVELSYRVAQITPKTALSAFGQAAVGKGSAKSWLPLVAGVGGLAMMLFRRRRRRSRGVGALGGVGLITTILALTSRASTILRIFAQLRALYMTYKATTRRAERP